MGVCEATIRISGEKGGVFEATMRIYREIKGVSAATMRISREIVGSRGGPGGRRRHDRLGGGLWSWAWEITTIIEKKGGL